jgi:hypothetical protein
MADLKPHCDLCAGSEEPGWLCEEHPDKPMGHDGCGGAGMACVCNPHAQVAWKEVYCSNEEGRPPQ